MDFELIVFVFICMLIVLFYYQLITCKFQKAPILISEKSTGDYKLQTIPKKIYNFKMYDYNELNFEYKKLESIKDKNYRRKNASFKIKRRMLELFSDFFGRATIWDYIALFGYILMPVIMIIVYYYNSIDIKAIKNIENIFIENNIEIYLGQVSLTFITISVMSIFSDSNEIVYWKDIVKHVLIEPPGRCFKAYFGYSFVSLLGSTIFTFAHHGFGLFIYFFTNIIALFNLTRVMVSCYYGKDQKKNKLERNLIKILTKFDKLILNEKLTNKETFNKKLYLYKINKFRKLIHEIFADFEYYTAYAYNNEKFLMVCDNLSVYGKLLAYMNDELCEEVLSIERISTWYNKKTQQGFEALLLNYYNEIEKVTSGKSDGPVYFVNNRIDKYVDKILIEYCKGEKIELKSKIIYYRFLTKLNSIQRILDTSTYFHPEKRIINYINKCPKEFPKDELIELQLKVNRELVLHCEIVKNYDINNIILDYENGTSKWCSVNYYHATEYYNCFAEYIATVLIQDECFEIGLLKQIPWKELMLTDFNCTVFEHDLKRYFDDYSINIKELGPNYKYLIKKYNEAKENSNI